MTYTLIDSTTLASSASSVTFSSITQDYGDLVLVVEGSGDSNANFAVNYNGDTGSNYSFVSMIGESSTASSSSSTLTYGLILFTQASQTGLGFQQIIDYSATDKHKSYLSRQNNAVRDVRAVAGRWANTSAITSIEISRTSGSINSGSTFFLYGIAKAL